MTVLHLVLRIMTVPVLWWRLPYMQHKHSHGNWVAKGWDLTMYDAMPLHVEYVQRKGWKEFVHFYGPNKNAVMGMTTGLTAREEGKPYLCGVADLLNRPTVPSQGWPWDIMFQGHREADQAYFGPKQKFLTHTIDMKAFFLCNPIYDWPDEAVWDYIKHYKLPIDKKRYYGKDQDVSPDSYRTCSACLDSTNAGGVVYCPKLQEEIPSVAETAETHERKLAQLTSLVRHVKYSGEPQRGVSAHV